MPDGPREFRHLLRINGFESVTADARRSSHGEDVRLQHREPLDRVDVERAGESHESPCIAHPIHSWLPGAFEAQTA